jgi:Bacterial TniB protein
VSLGYEHLEPSVREQLALPEQERIDQLSRPKWIGYPRARDLTAELESLLRHPKIHRMPNRLIVSETNNGKTMLAHRFARRHQAQTSAGLRMRVLVVQAPPVPDENRFFANILEALNAPYRAYQSAARRNIQVVHLLKALGLEMLIVDEIHHIVAGHERKQGHFLNTLKSLGNDLQIPLIGLGTIDALRAVQTDPQMTNRFEPLAIPKWTWDRDFRMLLASFERLVPLRGPSNLAGEQIGKRPLALSEGTIGELSTLLNRAAAEAIRSGREQIDCNVLSKTVYVSPSERRKHVEKLVNAL